MHGYTLDSVLTSHLRRKDRAQRHGQCFQPSSRSNRAVSGGRFALLLFTNADGYRTRFRAYIKTDAAAGASGPAVFRCIVALPVQCFTLTENAGRTGGYAKGAPFAEMYCNLNIAAIGVAHNFPAKYSGGIMPDKGVGGNGKEGRRGKAHRGRDRNRDRYRIRAMGSGPDSQKTIPIPIPTPTPEEYAKIGISGFG